MTFALKIASSMCFSSDLMTHLILLTTCWTSGGRLQLECSRNLATNILVSLYIFRSASECGRSLDEFVCWDRGLRKKSIFLSSFGCLRINVWLSLAPTPSVVLSLESRKKGEEMWQTLKHMTFFFVVMQLKHTDNFNLKLTNVNEYLLYSFITL